MEFAECAPLDWISRPGMELFEQIRLGRDGHSMTLLWAPLRDIEGEEDGPEELGILGFRSRSGRR